MNNSDEVSKTTNTRDRARRSDEHDRALARAWLLEARAHGTLGHTDQAIDLAKKSYQKFASVEGAREAARWLDKGGKTEEAVQYLAGAFTIGALQSANPEAEHDREQMGELYRKLNGSEKGLGDLILKSYDRTFSELASRREKIRQMDPNAQAKEPMSSASPTFPAATGSNLPRSKAK